MQKISWYKWLFKICEKTPKELYLIIFIKTGLFSFSTDFKIYNNNYYLKIRSCRSISKSYTTDDLLYWRLGLLHQNLCILVDKFLHLLVISWQKNNSLIILRHNKKGWTVLLYYKSSFMKKKWQAWFQSI